MKIESQVCSKEQGTIIGKAYKDYTPLFVWVGNKKDGYEVKLLTEVEDNGDGEVGYAAPAYTVAELGIILAPIMEQNKPKIPELIHNKYGNSLINAYNPLFLADCLIYLIQNKLNK